MLHDPLDFSLPPPDRLLHFAPQDFLTRWRIQKAESEGLPPTPEDVSRAEARLSQMAQRLERMSQSVREANQ